MPQEPPYDLAAFTVIIPTLNEGDGIESLLMALAPLRERGGTVILVDGESEDDTLMRVGEGADQVHVFPSGRAAQMNAGAGMAQTEWLWFLHADSQVPDALLNALATESARIPVWACCPVWIDGQSPLLSVIAFFMNWRSRLSGIATGDQSLLIRRDVFAAVGGFIDQPLMEDVAMSVNLRARYGKPKWLSSKLGTSGRRWEKGGLVRTQCRMWWLRWRYWRGASPAVLSAIYRPEEKG